MAACDCLLARAVQDSYNTKITVNTCQAPQVGPSLRLKELSYYFFALVFTPSTFFFVLAETRLTKPLAS
jgi:hypothetical protein